MDRQPDERSPRRRLTAVSIALALVLGVAACGSNSSAADGSGGTDALIGAGSTLVAPLVEEWTNPYHHEYGVAVTYGAIGSGGGIAQLTARTVDFGTSDAPLTPSQASACKGCLEIPWALSATDVAYNVQGVSSGLRFTGPVLAKIWMGQITKWNDPLIRALNPDVKLPDTTIVPVHRTDGSGDTFAFTNYLSKVSPAFRSQIGNATSVNFPGGIGGKGNSGVGGVLSSTNGAIAYITIAYVLQGKFDYALVRNAAGRYPTPNRQSMSAAAEAVNSIPSGASRGISLTDPPASAPNAYPISTFSYILAPKRTPAATAVTLRKFIRWAITDGQAYGLPLDFAPLPAAVVAADTSSLALIR